MPFEETNIREEALQLRESSVPGAMLFGNGLRPARIPQKLGAIRV